MADIDYDLFIFPGVLDLRVVASCIQRLNHPADHSPDVAFFIYTPQSS